MVTLYLKPGVPESEVWGHDSSEPQRKEDLCVPERAITFFIETWTTCEPGYDVNIYRIVS